jgi:hypothetical protein
MSTVELKVTKRHFDLAAKASGGQKSAQETCLLAQAFITAFPKKFVSVGYSSATVGRGKSERQFNLSSKTERLIHRFDDLVLSIPESDRTKAEKRAVTELRDSLPVTVKVTEKEVVTREE